MVVNYSTNNPLLKINDFDSEKDIISKIFISLENGVIPLSGIYIQSRKKEEIKYLTILDVLKNKKLIMNFNDYLFKNTVVFSKLYEELLELFPNLTKEELVVLNSYILNDIIPGLNVNKEEIVNFINSNLNLKEILIKPFLKSEIINKNIMKYIGNLNNYSIIISSINIKITKTPIDIYKIIKNYKLSRYVPFMIVIKEYSDEPIIKYLNDLNKNLLKDWVYASGDQIKKPKGLNVKILFNENSNDFDYKNLNISRSTPNIHLKIGFKDVEDTKYQDIYKVQNEIQKFLDEIKEYIPKENLIPLKFNIINFSIKLNLNEPVNIKKVQVYLRNNFRLYSSEEFDDRVKFKTYTKDYLFNLKTRDNNSILNISQLQIEDDIIDSIKIFFTMLTDALESKIIIQEIKKKEGQKKSRKLKELKNLGIQIKSADCQKIRHVDIYDDSIKIKEDSYILDYKDVKLYCESDNYPYPGFTNLNSPCCFKKDQRNKPVFLRNTNNTNSQKILPDKEILKSNLITTDKILDANRRGIIFPLLSDIFDDSYFRIGVYHDNSFFNSMEFLIEQDVSDILKQGSNLNKYKELKLNGNKSLSEIVNYEDYSSALKTLKNIGKMKKEYTQNLFENILKKGIIVLSVDLNLNTLSMEISDLFWDLDDYKSYFVILKVKKENKTVFEPVAKVIKNSIIREFKNSESVIVLLHKVYQKFNEKKLSPLSYEPPSLKTLIKDSFNVNNQLVNLFNKIEYVSLDDGILPVKLTTPYPGIKQIDSLKFTSLKKQMKILNNFSRKYIAYKPEALFINLKGKTVGILTYSGINVPVIPTKEKIENLDIINGEIPFDISNLLYEGEKVGDPISNYVEKVKYKKELYERFRLLLSSIFKQNEELKTEVKNIITDNVSYTIRNKTLTKTINAILEKFIIKSKKPLLVKELPSVRNVCHFLDSCDLDPFCKKNKENQCFLHVNQNQYEEMLNKLVLELFNIDEIFKGNIKIEFLDKNNFVPRNNEVILLSKEEILKTI